MIIDAHAAFVLWFLWKNIGDPLALPFGLSFGQLFSIETVVALKLPIRLAIGCIRSGCLWFHFGDFLFWQWHQVETHFIGLQGWQNPSPKFVRALTDIHVCPDEEKEHLPVLQDLL